MLMLGVLKAGQSLDFCNEVPNKLAIGVAILAEASSN